MNLHETIFELIDMRSFSNLWFWIALAVVWSTASHWVLGVPYDMVLRARRVGGQAEADLEDMVRININRILYINQLSGTVLLSFGCFILTVLGLLGFLYGVEFAQAVFLLAFPMSFVGLLSLRTAVRIRVEEPQGADLHKRLMRHRIGVQAIGVVAIFVTALWGMFKNFSIGVLGG
ncbi:component of SufBCD complex [Pseudooceanicola nanhaiensis]|uniref:component of SufBCD complex n=1 Tax=Pseudooceanicola nanhaiensis TaxID=375761 RepID=UPI001CD742C1|nr:component of SufBCD complex [Pseudooceanicola nanhaiensis]MCA0919857.1 component of SufBCD complex [Pseudooceanicola nanhaiensis]